MSQPTDRSDETTSETTDVTTDQTGQEAADRAAQSSDQTGDPSTDLAGLGLQEPLAPPLLEDDQEAPPRPEEDLADVERSDPEPHAV